MEILLTIAYVLLFLWLIRKLKFFQTAGISSVFLAAVFVLKVLCGTAMAFIYTHYYKSRVEADIFRYFDDSKVIYNALWQQPRYGLQILLGICTDRDYLHPIYTGMYTWDATHTNTIIRFDAIVRFFSFGYYSIHTVFMCFCSLAGLVGIYKTLSAHITVNSKHLAAGVFLMPSVLFWGSGVLKEGLIICCLGLLIWHFHLLLLQPKAFKNSAWVCVMAFLLLNTKAYILLLLLPSLSAWAYNKISAVKQQWVLFLSIHLLLFVGLYAIGRLFPTYSLPFIINSKQAEFTTLAETMKAGSYIQIPNPNGSFLSFIAQAPTAIGTALFRPHIFDAHNLFMWMSAIENAFIACLFILLIFRIHRIPFNNNLLLLCIAFSALLLLLIGCTIPVLGAIVRYKVPAIPFIWALLCCALPKKKLLA